MTFDYAQVPTMPRAGIRVGSIVQAAPGRGRGVLGNGARGRVIEDDGTAVPYKVQSLQDDGTNWYKVDDVVLAVTRSVH